MAFAQLLLAHSLRIDDHTRRTTAVPTNEQRRATAKRKLERQLERRAAQERRRRLYTIMERVFEDLSFDAPDLRGKRVKIDAAMVRQRLADVVKDEDLSRFIL